MFEIVSFLKFTNIAQFLGSPIIAVGIGLIILIYGLANKLHRKTVIEEMGKGVKPAGIIILVTGSGGAIFYSNFKEDESIVI